MSEPTHNEKFMGTEVKDLKSHQQEALRVIKWLRDEADYHGFNEVQGKLITTGGKAVLAGTVIYEIVNAVKEAPVSLDAAILVLGVGAVVYTAGKIQETWNRVQSQTERGQANALFGVLALQVLQEQGEKK